MAVCKGETSRAFDEKTIGNERHKIQIEGEKLRAIMQRFQRNLRESFILKKFEEGRIFKAL